MTKKEFIILYIGVYNMEIITLSDNREKVIELLNETEYNPKFVAYLHELTASDSFNIELAIDGDTLIDYRIFDPFGQYFSGYINPNGFSNWQFDRL